MRRRRRWLRWAGDLGLIVLCGDDIEPNKAAFVRMNVRAGSTTPVATVDYDGWGVAWVADAGTGYSRASSCGGGIRAFTASAAECFGGAQARYPAAAAGGRVFYLSNRCGTGDAEPAGTFAVCRHDGPGRDSVLRRGVRKPGGLAVDGDRVAIAGEIDGKGGLWLLAGRTVRRIAAGEYSDVAVAPGGGRVVAVLRDEGWFSTHWSVRILPMPS